MVGETVITQEALQQLGNDQFNKFVLDNAYFIDNVRHSLKREMSVPVAKEVGGQIIEVAEWVKMENSEPMMNDRAINFITGQLQMALDKATSTGKIETETAAKFTRNITMSIISELASDYKNYGMDDVIEIEPMRSVLVALLMNHLTKSVDMGFVDKLFTSTQIVENRNFNRGQEEKKPLSLGF